MNKQKQFNKSQFGFALLLITGLSIALGSSTGNYLIGISIALPIGIATYLEKTRHSKK